MGGRVGKKGQRGPRAVPPQGIGGFQARRGVARRQLHKVELVPGPLGVPGQQGVHPGQLLHDAGIRPASIIFQTLPLHPAAQHRVRAALQCERSWFPKAPFPGCVPHRLHFAGSESIITEKHQTTTKRRRRHETAACQHHPAVYNAQSHLARCLSSIRAQTYQNLEIIVLNDGSKDQSLPVCEEFRKKDSRIILVDKANSGVSDTRNLGLKLATGEYIQFVDSDDYIDPDYTGHLVAAAEEHHADLVIAPYKMVIPAGASNPNRY